MDWNSEDVVSRWKRERHPTRWKEAVERDKRSAEFTAAAEWNKQARESILNSIELQDLNKNIARNVIFFVGDGMGVSTVTSARILKGQKEGHSGEEAQLSFETFPHVALAKTYNTNQQVSDSAGTGTAYMCGVKSKAGTIGVDDRVEKGDCRSIRDAKVSSFMEIAADAGRAAGIVSTARITHATPACAYAHVPERSWERDTMVPGGEKAAGCSDIASQLIDSAQRFQVVMGGGRREMMPTSHHDPEYSHVRGNRDDGRDLINEWFHALPDGTDNMYVVNRDQLMDVNVNETDYLLGLFEPSHMLYHVERDELGDGDPSLAEMVEKAIQVLQKNDNGFFLFVEAGRIDHAHHKGRAFLALTDTIALDEAVTTAKSMTNDEDTLIVVTADHSHTNTIGGYPTRGNPILGRNNKELARDGLPYTTLLYANGPGGEEVRQSYRNKGRRPDVGNDDTYERDYRQQAAVPLSDESHAGEDVPIYATGAYAHLFHGTQEQNYIAHAIKYASCIGEYSDHCRAQATTKAPVTVKRTTKRSTTPAVTKRLQYAPVPTQQLPKSADTEVIERLNEQDDDGHSGNTLTYIPPKIELHCVMTPSSASTPAFMVATTIFCFVYYVILLLFR
ncbi:alkaline phosphatase-like [Saccoglossus kowalevskii]|uniref:Alkaline phosphatase n=1 Tax=Saccoglossus kowalevskii TaxID=10224 RepID=A0ABM0GLQ9_SACKO|nr:PREDICTED: alkaline phosphatase, tissue-nonspecific isozyme-like [Saccoglossus kowalevskii]